MAETDADMTPGCGAPESGAADPGVSGSVSPVRASLLRSVAPLLVPMTLLGCAMAYAEKLPCRLGGWNVAGDQFRYACYTDIYPLYFVEGLSDGKAPYVGHPVEYPVVIGAVMEAVARVVRPIADPFARGRAFFDLTVVLLTLAAVVAVLATASTAGRGRAKDALLFALAPGLILTAFVNWDLLAVALTALGLACWARRRQVWAGVLLGLAVATKFYPLVLFGPLFLLCLRAGRLRAFGRTFAAAAVSWLAVNLPVYLVAPAGWARFYTFSAQRPVDWGSIWYFVQGAVTPSLGTRGVTTINLLAAAGFLLGCLIVTVLALAAPRRPRLAQLSFLIVAAFLLTNKVWSPQYVLWLLPFVVLARPRWASYAVWQLAEIGYFFAIWYYLLGKTVDTREGIGDPWYFAALLGRAGAVLLLCVLVAVDILRPGRDVVRADGVDDPAGGVLDGAADRFVLPGRIRRPA